MVPRFNLWLEVEKQVVLSIWRVQLLEAIATTGSISKASMQLSVPYRVAWQKIHEMEVGIGQKLVETSIGGREGGGAQLTPLAKSYIAQFKQFTKEVEQFLGERYPYYFEGDWGENNS